MFDFYYFIYLVSLGYGCSPFKVLSHIDDFIIEPFFFSKVRVNDKYSFNLYFV